MLRLVLEAIVLVALSSEALCLPALEEDKMITNRSPILMFPGLAGSQLEINRRSSLLTPQCGTNGQYKTFWLDKCRYLSGWSKPVCIVDDLRLKFNSETLEFNYPKSVIDTRAKDFGKTSGVETLDGKETLKDFVQYFVDHGYTRGDDIRAAPYDWRLAANELQRHHCYYDKVRDLIETMYKNSNGTKVTLVCFSLGCPTSYQFITKYIDSQWKQDHIHAYVTVVGGWDGGVVALDALVSGGSGGVLPHFKQINELLKKLRSLKYIPVVLFRGLVGNFQSIYSVLPRASVWGNKTLIEFKDKKYSANDYKQMFKDLGLGKNSDKFSTVENMYGDYSTPPGVQTLCMYNTGINTPVKYKYKVGTHNLHKVLGNDRLIEVEYEDGDGLVSTRTASKVCSQLCDEQTAGCKHECKNLKHTEGCGPDTVKLVAKVVDLDECISLAPPTSEPALRADKLSEQSLLRDLLDSLVREMTYASIVQEMDGDSIVQEMDGDSIVQELDDEYRW